MSTYLNLLTKTLLSQEQLFDQHLRVDTSTDSRRVAHVDDIDDVHVVEEYDGQIPACCTSNILGYRCISTPLIVDA